MQPLQSLSVIGGGSWATALVKIFSESGIQVNWYLRSKQHVDYLLKHARNPNYLSYLELNMQNIKPSHVLEEVVSASEDILFAVPSAYLESTVHELDASLIQGKIIYVSIKGIVSDEFLVPSVFLAKHFSLDARDILVLGGPCHAEEIAMDRKTFLTVCGVHDKVVNRMCKAITSGYVTVVKNHDPLGVEYAAILKNVIGIASGMVKGLNYGDNFLAVVISNAMREIKQFLQTVDKRKIDLFDSAYFGDLLVTAYSEFSRNRSFGNLIGRGYSVPIATARMNMVAEGFPAVKGMHHAATSLKVKMPVLSCVYRILYKHASPFTEFKLLESQLR